MKEALRRIGKWLGWYVVAIAGCGGIELYDCGYHKAQAECVMSTSCDHKGGHLNWEKTKCVTEVEIPLAPSSSR